MVGLSYFQGCRVSFLIDERWLRDGWENTFCSITPNTTQTQTVQQQNHTVQIKTQTRWLGCLAVAILMKSRVHLNRRKMAGRLAGDGGRLPLVIPKDCGCNSTSLHDDWEMTAWLAPTSFKWFVCSCRLTTWLGGWLYVFSEHFGCVYIYICIYIHIYIYIYI